jgi:serine/threonine-protein kinase
MTGKLALARYRVESLLAHGGMASVYKAVDPVLNRPVAIKVLHAHLAADPSYVERFHREALAAAALTHPTVVSIFDTGDFDGRPCLVMELMSGGSLADRLRRSLLSPDEAVALGVAVARALSEAHRLGLVHRDVKPANILFTETGLAKLGDFGIAKAGLDALTQTGQLVGTARYLAPEQLRGQPATPHSDQFGLGVVLYEALAGRPPFGGPDDATGGLLRGPITPLRLLTRVPAALDAVVARALSEDPAHRFPDLNAVAQSLSGSLRADERPAVRQEGSSDRAYQPTMAWAEPRPASLGRAAIRAQPGGRRRRSRGGVAAAILATVALLAGGVIAILLARDARDKSDASSPSSSGPPPVALQPVAAQDFNPLGKGSEHRELAPNVIDGDPGTSWMTSTYDEQFPALKPGVGIWVDLEVTHHVSYVKVVSPDQDWVAEIRVSDAATPPSQVDGWKVVGKVTDAAPEIAFSETEIARRVLVWITHLPSVRGGFRMRVAKIEVFGR